MGCRCGLWRGRRSRHADGGLRAPAAGTRCSGLGSDHRSGGGAAAADPDDDTSHGYGGDTTVDCFGVRGGQPVSHWPRHRDGDSKRDAVHVVYFVVGVYVYCAAAGAPVPQEQGNMVVRAGE